MTSSFSSFYNDMLSNASLDIYANSTMCFFSNLLSNSIKLRDENANTNNEWEVALTDIAFPNQLYNFVDGKISFGYAQQIDWKQFRVIQSIRCCNASRKN